MNSIPKTSPELLKERLEQLKESLPDLFTNEGQLNEDELRNIISQFTIPQTERYEFRWTGKAHSKKLAFTPSKATLAPDEKRSINFDKTENIIIEGDNLEVLKLLQKSYFNQIKCIYIDPPYNTGNDFIYNDDFSENKKAYWEKNGIFKDGVKLDSNTESIGRYHSNWLSMMQSRLLLARNLLKEEGVIFVSIDDHEIANLRKLLDEVFGEENFVVNIIWEKLQTRKNSAKYFSESHDYILCFAKNLELFQRKLIPREDDSNYTNPDSDPKGPWKLDRVYANNPYNADYTITNPEGAKVSRPNGKYWRYSEETINKFIQENKLVWSKGGKYPNVKRYLSEVQEGLVPVSIFDRLFAGDNGLASRELSELLGSDKIMSYPKPTKLIIRLLQTCTNSKDNDLIMDFFAGSGTTAHAVMELNKEDEGNRKCILVQLPESTDKNSDAFKAGYKTISDICIERVKKAGNKINKENEKIDTGFKVFKLTYSHFPENLFTPDPNKTEKENIQEFKKYLEKVNQQVLFDFEADKLLYEIALKDGFNLNFNIEYLKKFEGNKVIKIKDDVKEALVCLDQSISDKTIEQLKQYKDQRFICLKRAVDTTKKWNLQQLFEKNLWVA